ncbi:MAG: oligosaccharide flippase family protein, partial [Nitrososphaerota archaeon]
LSPAEFGVYSLVDITILVLVTVTQLGLGVSYLKWFADLGETQRGTILGSTLITGSLAAFVGGGLLAIVVASPLGERWLQIPERSFAWTLLPIVVLENVQGLLLTDLRARRKAVIFSAAALIRLLAILGASMWFIVVQQREVAGVFLGRLAGDSIGVLMLAALSLRSTALSFAWPVVAAMVRYGLPLIWSGLVWIMMEASGRYFLSHYSTMEQIGLYSAAIKIANIFQMLVTQPFSVAWGGLMFQIVKMPNAPLVYSRITSATLVISVIIASIVALFGPELLALLTAPTFFAAEQVLPILLLVRIVQTMDYPVSAGAYLGGATWLMAFLWTFGFGLSIVANVLLVPENGMIGAAVAWLIGEIAIMILLGLVGRFYYPIRYELLPFMFALGVFFCLLEFKKVAYRSVTLTIILSFGLILAGLTFLGLNSFRKLEQKGGKI